MINLISFTGLSATSEPFELSAGPVTVEVSGTFSGRFVNLERRHPGTLGGAENVRWLPALDLGFSRPGSQKFDAAAGEYRLWVSHRHDIHDADTAAAPAINVTVAEVPVTAEAQP
jgi:hypothetical protein